MYLLPFQIAIIAYVYAIILTKPGMLFGEIYGRLTTIEMNYPWTGWLLKPLMTCVYCVAGQMAFRVLLLFHFCHLQFIETGVDALFFPSLTILFVQVLNKLLHE
jgi:hypothetical protein